MGLDGLCYFYNQTVGGDGYTYVLNVGSDISKGLPRCGLSEELSSEVFLNYFNLSFFVVSSTCNVSAVGYQYNPSFCLALGHLNYT